MIGCLRLLCCNGHSFDDSRRVLGFRPAVQQRHGIHGVVGIDSQARRIEPVNDNDAMVILLGKHIEQFFRAIPCAEGGDRFNRRGIDRQHDRRHHIAEHGLPRAVQIVNKQTLVCFFFVPGIVQAGFRLLLDIRLQIGVIQLLNSAIHRGSNHICQLDDVHRIFGVYRKASFDKVGQHRNAVVVPFHIVNENLDRFNIQPFCGHFLVFLGHDHHIRAQHRHHFDLLKVDRQIRFINYTAEQHLLFAVQLIGKDIQGYIADGVQVDQFLAQRHVLKLRHSIFRKTHGQILRKGRKAERIEQHIQYEESAEQMTGKMLAKAPP